MFTQWRKRHKRNNLIAFSWQHDMVPSGENCLQDVFSPSYLFIYLIENGQPYYSSCIKIINDNPLEKNMHHSTIKTPSNILKT